MGTITIPKVCIECKAHIRVVVDSFGYSKWIRGTPVQIAFPELDVDKRELLVSNMCGKCFDKLFDKVEGSDAES